MKYKKMQLYCGVYEQEGKLFAQPIACNNQNFALNKLGRLNCLGVFKLEKPVKFDMEKYISDLPKE
jgi:hypothetical protein